jgi:hypothetical protein
MKKMTNYGLSAILGATLLALTKNRKGSSSFLTYGIDEAIKDAGLKSNKVTFVYEFTYRNIFESDYRVIRDFSTDFEGIKKIILGVYSRLMEMINSPIDDPRYEDIWEEYFETAQGQPDNPIGPFPPEVRQTYNPKDADKSDLYYAILHQSRTGDEWTLVHEPFVGDPVRLSDILTLFEDFEDFEDFEEIVNFIKNTDIEIDFESNIKTMRVDLYQYSTVPVTISFELTEKTLPYLRYQTYFGVWGENVMHPLSLPMIPRVGTFFHFFEAICREKPFFKKKSFGMNNMVALKLTGINPYLFFRRLQQEFNTDYLLRKR